MPKLDQQSVSPGRRARLFRNGRNQAVRIPRELELPGTDVLIHKEGERLVIEPVTLKSELLKVVSTLEHVSEEFPDVDESLEPLNDVKL